METFVLRWTKDNLPFWQGIDGGDKYGIYEVADVINENARLKARESRHMIERDQLRGRIWKLVRIGHEEREKRYRAERVNAEPKETNDD